MDVDESNEMDLDEPSTDLEEVSVYSDDDNAASKMLTDDEEEIVEPKPKKKRTRSSMTPSSGDGKKRQHLPRTIAVKRSASATLMDSEDEDDLNAPSTPRGVSRGRSDRSLSSRKLSPSSSHEDGLSSRLSSRSNLTDATEEFGESLSRPPRKKTKQSEPVATATPTDFVSRSSSSPLHQTRSPIQPHEHQPHAPSDKPKTPSVFSNFISRILPTRATPTPSNGPRDSSSEPNNEARRTVEEDDDSIASPNVRANSSSAPHSVGSPSTQPQYPNYGYANQQHEPTPYSPMYRGSDNPPVFGIRNFEPPPMPYSPHRPEYARSRSGEVDNDYVQAAYADPRSNPNNFRSPVRSASGRYLNSPAASHSPTSYMASPQAPVATAVWGARSPMAARSPSPPQQYDTSRRPIGHQGIHSPPSSANRRHPHYANPDGSPVRHGSSGKTSQESKPVSQRSALMNDVIRALRNFLFLLVVCLLLGLVVWLFSGDIWRKIFGVNQARLHEECADRLKEVLRSRAGEFDCGYIKTPAVDAEELMIAKDALCTSGEKPLEWSQLSTKLAEDLEVVPSTQGTSLLSFRYVGDSPSRPWGCLLSKHLFRFLKAYGIHIAGVSSVLILVRYALFRFRRGRADGIRAREIAFDIIRMLQVESSHPKHNGSLIKDLLEADFTNTADGKRVWPQVVDIIERNARVQIVPKDLGGAQVQAWAWSSS